MSEIGRFSKLAAAALLLSGCAVGPDFQTPAPAVPSSFLPGHRHVASVPGRTVVASEAVPSQWWKLFHSAELDRLVQDGIANNSDLEGAEAALRVAQANARVQQAALFPTVGANFNSSRQKVSDQVSSDVSSGANIYSLHTAQVSVSFVPDIWGGTRRQLESAAAEAENRAFQREAVFVTLTSNIAAAAIEEARLRDQIAATRRIVGLQTDVLNILRRQNEQGQIALPDVIAQETAVAQGKLLLPALERDLAKQQNLLAFLTGRYPSEASKAAFRLASFRLPRRLPVTLPADLIRQRPDIRAAEANLHAANAQIGAALANRLPQIVLSANRGTAAEQISNLFSPGMGAWAIAGNVAHTVFDAGALENKQRAAEAATDQALAQYRGVVLAAFQNVADVLRALQADARAYEAASAAESSAERNVKLVGRQVEQGQVSVPLLLAAQQAYLQVSLARVDAQASRLANTVALFQALGGGRWERSNEMAPWQNEKEANAAGPR